MACIAQTYGSTGDQPSFQQVKALRSVLPRKWPPWWACAGWIDLDEVITAFDYDRTTLEAELDADLAAERE